MDEKILAEPEQTLATCQRCGWSSGERQHATEADCLEVVMDALARAEMLVWDLREELRELKAS